MRIAHAWSVRANVEVANDKISLIMLKFRLGNCKAPFIRVGERAIRYASTTKFVSRMSRLCVSYRNGMTDIVDDGERQTWK